MDVLVATFIGQDGPGLVHALAEVVSDHGGNWESSHMESVGGVFVGVLTVTVGSEATDGLVEDLEGLAGMLEVRARRAEPLDHHSRSRVLVVELTGGDHPGIVEVVAAAVARPKVNVLTLDSVNTREPHGGPPSCRVRAELDVDDTVDIAALAAELRALAEDLSVDITVDGIEPR